MFNQVEPLIRRSVTPIGRYTHTPDGVRQFGTGTLFAVGNAHFVVTAAHVIDQARELDCHLCGFAYGEQTESGTSLLAIPLNGERRSWVKPLDIGIIKLCKDSVSQLTGRRFLRLCDVSLRPVDQGWGWVSGFPLKMVQAFDEKSEAFNPLNWGSVISTEEPQDVQEFDPRFHFVLQHDPSTTSPLNHDGSFQLPASFKGISGAAVWQTWWPGDDSGEEWRSRRIRVVGVQTGCYRRYTIRATNWAAAAIVIYSAVPELQPVFEMHFNGWNIKNQIERLARKKVKI